MGVRRRARQKNTPAEPIASTGIFATAGDAVKLEEPKKEEPKEEKKEKKEKKDKE